MCEHQGQLPVYLQAWPHAGSIEEPLRVGQGCLHATGTMLPVPGVWNLHPALGTSDHQADMLLQPCGESLGQQV